MRRNGLRRDATGSDLTLLIRVYPLQRLTHTDSAISVQVIGESEGVHGLF